MLVYVYEAHDGVPLRDDRVRSEDAGPATGPPGRRHGARGDRRVRGAGEDEGASAAALPRLRSERSRRPGRASRGAALRRARASASADEAVGAEAGPDPSRGPEAPPLMPVLVDTGILYAVADAGDAWHPRVRDWLEGNTEPLLVPITVVPEVTYLLAARLGAAAERAFVASLVAGELGVEPVTRADVERCRTLLDEYPHIGFVDG